MFVVWITRMVRMAQHGVFSVVTGLSCSFVFPCCSLFFRVVRFCSVFFVLSLSFVFCGVTLFCGGVFFRGDSDFPVSFRPVIGYFATCSIRFSAPKACGDSLNPDFSVTVPRQHASLLDASRR